MKDIWYDESDVINKDQQRVLSARSCLYLLTHNSTGESERYDVELAENKSQFRLKAPVLKRINLF